MKLSLGTGILVVATAVVVVSVVAGIVVVGSPAEGRLEQLDSGRMEDLRGIMSAIDFTFAMDSVLPPSLDDLAENPRMKVNTLDPGTLRPYEYRVLDDDSYELCATFDREGSEPEGRAATAFWAHPAGRHCFELDARVRR
jgi:hypothetical protein